MKSSGVGRIIAGALAMVLCVSGTGAFADMQTTQDQQGRQLPVAGQQQAPPSFASLLAQYVTSGVLTQTELDAIDAWMKTQDAARKAEMDAIRNLTEEQRKAQTASTVKEPISFKQQLLGNSLITEAQATAIDWTKIERPDKPTDSGQKAGIQPPANAKAVEKAAVTSAVSDAGITVLLNGTELTTTVKSHADRNGRTLIELRSVAEALGAAIAWDADTQKVTLTSGMQTVAIRINQSSYHVNGSAKTMDTAAVIESGHTMVPVRVIAEALGAAVSYDSATRTVTITQ